jgi:sRNA-binding protein
MSKKRNPEYLKRQRRRKWLRDRPKYFKRSRALLVMLSQHYPQLFDQSRPVPLARGFHKELKAEIPELPYQVNRLFMHWWVTRANYLRALAADGAVRHHLDGTVSEPVTPKEKEHAAEALRKQKQDVVRIVEPPADDGGEA